MSAGEYPPARADEVFASERRHKDLTRRLAAVEARQRAQGVHDPDCARTLAVVAFYARRDIYTARAFDAEHEEAVATPCDCWLSREKGYLAGLAGRPQCSQEHLPPMGRNSTDVGTVNGVMDFGSPIIHIARKFRTALCGAGTQGNVVPIGAVRLDDPHLCTDCKQMRAGRDDL